MPLVIDCHGHHTVAPQKHLDYREAQKACLADASLPYPTRPDISDDEIREGVEANQQKLIRERGIDLTIFSPRASRIEPHIGDEA
ncbi:MAG: amidohydrolase, partial [Pseudomonadota bacterium]